MDLPGSNEIASVAQGDLAMTGGGEILRRCAPQNDIGGRWTKNDRKNCHGREERDVSYRKNLQNHLTKIKNCAIRKVSLLKGGDSM